MERIFCNAFQSEDLSRSDISIDSKIDNIGIGLKTYLKSASLQKIAEFNEARSQYDNITDLECKAVKIAELRNERIMFTARAYDLDIDKLIYHCILREKGQFSILEENMSLIDIQKISKVRKTKGGFSFSDNENEYSFSLSKSTLLKRFEISSSLFKFEVPILDNPLELLENLFKYKRSLIIDEIVSTIYLPLYSPRSQMVETRSGLNQWNANGRKRDADEVYIPVPAFIHKNFPNFFPNSDTVFDLKLPNGASIKAKICQDGGKALMSDPNKALGKWLLRDVLKLKEGTLVTIDKLNAIGIDSVRIDKTEKCFEINFAKTGTYGLFEMNNLKNTT
jgi:hypothetical protein